MTTIREGQIYRFAEAPAAVVEELREMVEAKAVAETAGRGASNLVAMFRRVIGDQAAA